MQIIEVVDRARQGKTEPFICRARAMANFTMLKDIMPVIVR